MIVTVAFFFVGEPVLVEDEEVVDETSVEEEDIVDADSSPAPAELLLLYWSWRTAPLSMLLVTYPSLLLPALPLALLLLVCCWDSMAIRLTDTRAADAGRSGLNTAP